MDTRACQGVVLILEQLPPGYQAGPEWHPYFKYNSRWREEVTGENVKMSRTCKMSVTGSREHEH